MATKNPLDGRRKNPGPAPSGPYGEMRDLWLRVRISETEQGIMRAAAGDSTMSDWARETLLRAAMGLDRPI